MDIFTKIIEILKIPLKVLLPALWLFSGLLTFLNDDILTKLFLLEWRNKNGFVFGIIFLITSCLILIYILIFVLDKLSDFILNATINKKTIKRLSKLDNARFSIIMELYHSPRYTGYFDYGDPLIQALLAENYIYTGGQQLVSIDIINNKIPIRCTLQPFVYRALDNYKVKFEREMEKLSNKVNAEKNANKKTKIQKRLYQIREIYNNLYN